MFRSRRAGLVRRLWRQRCAAASPEDGPSALKPAVHALFKKLKDEELELLVQVVESRGAWESGCVLAPQGDSRGVKQGLPPQVLLCRLFRWPDLHQPHELKHFCYCAGGQGVCGDLAVLCCNPHHFSRLAVPETPPPPYLKASCGPSWPDDPQHPSTRLLEFSYNGGDCCAPCSLLEETLPMGTHTMCLDAHSPSSRLAAGHQSHQLPLPHLPLHSGTNPAHSTPPPLHHGTWRLGTTPETCTVQDPVLRYPWSTTSIFLSSYTLCAHSPWPVQLLVSVMLSWCQLCSPLPDTSLSWNTVKDGCWCKLAYWEYRTRVGRLYAVHEAAVNVFCELPWGNGFCLAQLPAAYRSCALRRARGKIGRGLLLSREPGGVWAYNRSEHPIFVSSPTLSPPGAWGLTVLKVLPGYSAKVFDYEWAGDKGGWQLPGEGPCDPHSIHISFAKGWGPCYSRQFITSCPCWLEVLLNQPC